MMRTSWALGISFALALLHVASHPIRIAQNTVSR